MIDENGFRLNVGMIIINSQTQCLWARRANNPKAWQFPQGGISAGESEQEAMYRELAEEVGLSPEHVQIIGKTQEWLFYRLPSEYRRYDRKSLCVGQKQKWFLLKLVGEDKRIKLDCNAVPEFDRWLWVDYWHPLKEIISFKREVYRQVLKQFEPFVF